MPVPNTLSDLSPVAASNSPQGTESAKGTIDDYFRAAFAFIAQLANLAGGPTTTLASAASVAIGFANTANIAISGSATVTSFDSVAEGSLRYVTFSGAATLAHNAASLILPGAANIVTASGDSALFKSMGAGNWKCLSYQRAAAAPNAASASSSGYLTATDWSTFNAKQAAGVCLPLAGGTMTGNATFGNNQGILFTDTLGAVRPVLTIGGDNVVNITNTGGASIRFNNSAGGQIAALAENGNYYFTSHLHLPNNVGLFSKDAAGNERDLLIVAADNNTYLSNVGGGSLIFNSKAGAQIAILSNAGGFTASTLTATSDERKKKGWQRLPADFLDRLAGIRKSGLFSWRKGGLPGLGVGAQSLEAILPVAVETDERGHKSVNYGAAALVSAVELAREVVKLRARLAALEAK